MKLRNLYLFFIVFLSFYSKAQSVGINEPVLANSESLLMDSLPNKGPENPPTLSIQESKLDGNTEHVIQQKANLKVSEAVLPGKTKAVIKPDK